MQAEAIDKGATRPAMKFGVPLVPLVLLFGGAMLVVIWVGALLSWWIVPIMAIAVEPVLGWMRFVTARDDQRFRQVFVAAKLGLADRNQRFRHSHNHSPCSHRDHRDESPRWPGGAQGWKSA
jgi:type IV secretion system protein VirB3